MNFLNHTNIMMKFPFILLITLAPICSKAENLNDVPFYAFQDSQVLVEKDSMYRVGNAVIFKYRIDVESSRHPWKTLTRTVKTQCDSNNFMTIKAIIVFKDPNESPQEIKGNDVYVQYEANSYREQMTKYVCENAPN